MQSAEKSLALLHFLSYKGEKLTPRWSELVGHLRGLLRRAGIEEKGSSPELLIFSFYHPLAAISHVTGCIASCKQSFGWSDIGGPLPVQLIFHLSRREDPIAHIFESTAKLWNPLQPEKIYVTRTLKNNWTVITTGRKMPDHDFVPEGEDVFLLELTGKDPIRTEKLFPHRNLPLAGTHPVCFYCGMTRHEAKDCPSKQLPPVTNALEQAGYISLPDFSAAFQNAFFLANKLHEQYPDGITPALIRANPDLSSIPPTSMPSGSISRDFSSRWPLATTPAGCSTTPAKRSTSTIAISTWPSIV